MQDALLPPLKEITRTADVLLLETDLNDTQRRFLQAVYDAAKTMLDMVVSFPTIDNERAFEVFAYEVRSLLASMIGYVELLLDEDDGALSESQRVSVNRIRAAGKQIVRSLPEVME
jgi:signal transduction histidine kinase